MELSLLPFLFFFLLLLHLTVTLIFPRPTLPPGPPAAPFVGNLFYLRRSFKLHHLRSFLRTLRSRYGPILTLRIGSSPLIFISDASLAHRALIQNGAFFSDRPSPLPSARFLSSNQHIISAAAYGPLWRILRRNLVSETLHPSRVRDFAGGRRWTVDRLADELRAQSESGDGVVVPRDGFQFAMFRLLVLMCFGEGIDERVVREIELAQRNYLLQVSRLTFLSFLPGIVGFLFRGRLRVARELRRRQKEVFLPLIRGCEERRKRNGVPVCSYVDSLVGIELPEDGGRGLNEDELVALCSEFLNAGTDTTSTTLQWIMAELVKNQEVQIRLWEEIERGWDASCEEEDLEKRMPYLKAVVMEGLRLHPPSHFVLPHSVTEEIKFEGYLIPKNAAINFSVAEMALDERIWEDAKGFKPERFMEGGSAEGVDITGSREIKMMPFGAGRRICPGLGLAMFHLEYFVANLVKEFEWRKVEGEEVDLSEKLEFTVVMKNSLRARLVPRKEISSCRAREM